MEIGIGISIVALVVAALGVYYNKKAVPPPPDKADDRRTRVAPLLQQGTGVRPKIKVIAEDGGELSDPRVVTVVLENAGTAAISESCTTATHTSSSSEREWSVTFEAGEQFTRSDEAPQCGSLRTPSRLVRGRSTPSNGSPTRY